MYFPNNSSINIIGYNKNKNFYMPLLIIKNEEVFHKLVESVTVIYSV